MDSARWHRIETLFHETLELPEEQRETFLRRACSGDESLYNEVMALLDADDAPHSLLEGRAIDVVDGVPANALPEGTRVGPYRIVGVVGMGGMGAVYLAERADGQFEQRVALKLIKRGMDTETILARFHAERRILARLQHPNIATLLDGGVTDDGLPFFTMEYVDGRPITRYCDENRLSIEGRLDLFQAVCAAVQYAHGNLVVHRDLKPSNILVTNDGHVKLLDFGIARVLDEDEDGLTHSGQRVMTPAYASPEQIRGEPVTTATDVYSLGVVLYELLCGRHPHRDTTSTPAELERAIAQTPAERPSRFITRIETVGSGSTPPPPEEVARARRMVPARLQKRLEGDLDNICLMALRKEPGRRYSSASALLEDVRHHLSGRPVSARPDTVRYRFGKFVRRNRVGVASTAALVVLVTALTVLYTTRLAHERDRARLEAEKAAEVSKFLTGLFESADPYTSRGEAITARELLDKGAERVRTELEDQPDVLADMLITIGNAYGNLGLLDQAITTLKEAYGIRERLFGRRNAATVQAAWRIEEYLVLTGAYEEADSIGRAAVATARELGDQDLLANALGSLGQCVNYEAKYDEAEKFYNEAIQLRTEFAGANDVEMTPIMNNLALMYHELSRYEEADSLFRRALAIQEKEWGDRHPETNTTRYNYAQLLSDEGHLSRAQEMWKEVLANDRALFPAGHPSIAFTLSAYGRLLSRIGGYAEAEELQREALAIRRKNHGDVNPDVAYSLNSLGSALLDEAKYDEAERCYNEAYEINVQLSGHTQPVLGIIMNNRGDLHYEIGDYARADSLLRAAYAYQMKLSGGEDRNSTSVTLTRHARVQQAMGNLAEAERLAREGVAISDRLHEDRGLWAAGAKVFLAEIRLAQGAVEEAETTFANALETIRDMETGRPARPRDTESLLGLGKCRLARGDAAGAERYLREALDISVRYRGDAHPETARIKIALARALMAAHRDNEAGALLRESITALSPVVLPRQIDLAAARRLLKENAAGMR